MEKFVFLKALRKREFPLHFAKGKKLFQIIVRLSDAPGSLRSVLDTLAPRVNMIGITSYTLGDGTAVVSCFAEAISSNESSNSIQRLLGSSPATLEAEVREGQDGLLVDTFHTGLEVGNEDYMMLNREGMNGVFDHIVKIFGSGGEVLLYEEGLAMAQKNSQTMESLLGPRVVKANTSYLVYFLSAQGWGTFEAKQGRGNLEYTVKVSDCFECAKGSETRKQCDFMRGYFEGAGSATFGVPLRAEEVECTLRGAKACVFRISPRKTK